MNTSAMPKCRTCKWWERAADAESPQGACWAIAPSKSAFIVESTDAVISTAQEEGVRFLTGPDFGCVQHEPMDVT